MFNICRRGGSSLSKVLRAAPPACRISSSRLPPLSLSSQFVAKPSTEARLLHVSSILRNEAVARQINDSTGGRKEHQIINKFDQLVEHNLVHPHVVEAITLPAPRGMGHHTMTDVQTLTINQGLEGVDIIAQARTGTGKTIGFLIPTVQNILTKIPELAQRNKYSRARASDIQAIIISPTRELAEQIATEAAKLTRNTDLIVQVAVGGNSKREMLKKTRREGCHILVATPGRLNDLLTDPYSGIRAPQLTTLVLDEADRLLDDGFSRDIEAIINLLPRREEVDRQTLMFSATVPRAVMHLVKDTLKPDFHFVQTVKEGDLATHQKVPQKVVAMPGIENFLPTIFELAKRQMDLHAKGEGLPFKAIIYFQSTANVELAYRTFDNLTDGGRFTKSPLYPAEISQIHGKLTQERRGKVTENFRRAKSALLFSTDVTARGMDFPNVTHVIQYGLPENREQYIHRIGRTGRGDKTGTGYLLIHDSEMNAATNQLRKIPIEIDESLQCSKVDMTQDAQLPADVANILSAIGQAGKAVDRDTKQAAFMGMLNAAKNMGRGAIGIMNQWTKYGWGWEEPPHIGQGIMNRLGLQVDGGNGGRRGFGGGRGGSGGRGFGDQGGSGFGGRGFGQPRDRGYGSPQYGNRGRDGERGGGRGFGGRQDRGGVRDRGGRSNNDRHGFGGKDFDF